MKTKITLMMLFVLSVSIAFAQKPRQNDLMRDARAGQNYPEGANIWRTPYTIFNNVYQGPSPLGVQLAFVRGKLLSQTSTWEPLRNMYKQLYGDSEVGPLANPGNRVNKDDPFFDKGASIAKNAAFALLLGAKVTGVGNTISEIDNTSDAALRIQLRDKAIGIIMSCQNNIPGSIKKVQWRTKELIAYLQAYDMLKAVHEADDTFITLDQIVDMRVKLQYFARNLYRKHKGVGSFSLRNNHALMTAGALGLAAIVLHDAGFNRSRKNWHPAQWWEASNWKIQQAMFELGRSMAYEDKETGFAEGPHYFSHAFENLMPFFLAHKNFMTNTEPITYKWRWHHAYAVKYYWNNPAYKRLFDWYTSIAMPSGNAPTYDNTYTVDGADLFLSIFRDPNYVYAILNRSIGFDLRADFIAAGLVPNSPARDANYVNIQSGDIVFRTPFSTRLGNSHYIHMNVEEDRMSQHRAHEHPDALNIIISAGIETLIIDPAYFGYDNRGYINEANNHNVVRKTTSGGPKKSTDVSVSGVEITDAISIATAHSSYDNADITRTTEMRSENGNTFYVVKDQIDATGNDEWTLSWHGNGYTINNTCDTVSGFGGAMVRWTHPCVYRPSDTTWSIQAFSVVKGGNADYSLTSYYNGNNGNNYIGVSKNTRDNSPPFEGDEKYGDHSILNIEKVDDNPTFLTVLWPYKCDSTPPAMNDYSDAFRAKINIENIGPDSNDVIIEAQTMSSTGVITDTDPFRNSGTENLKYDAAEIYMSYSKKDQKVFSGCTAFTRFRNASIRKGTYLIYDTDTLIEATASLNATYTLTGKYKYKGVVNVPDAGGSSRDVTFYLPDYASIGFDLVAINLEDNSELSSSLNITSSRLTITFEQGKTTQFEIKLADPCLLSCFFPETHVTIDTLFDFNSGLTETLGHDLDIVQPFGWLKQTEGSKTSICTDFTLVNKDSITLKGLWDRNDDALPYYTEYNENGDPVSTMGPYVQDREASNKAMIIINDRAALVLDSNSYTHLGVNSTILVKKGGTLLVRNTATLEIGGEGGPGVGEVIAEDGAYVCIEPDANVFFYKDSSDTTDKHIFFVSMKPSVGTIAGVNTNGGGGRFASPTGIYSGSNCVAFCDLKNQSPYKIDNKEWGWANIGEIEAHFSLKDTFCPVEPILLDARKTLNETKFYFEICEYNIGTSSCSGGTVTIPSTAPSGKWDSLRVDSLVNLAYFFSFSSDKHYKVRMIIKNDCEDRDTLDSIFYMADVPTATFTLADSACPGVGSVVVDGSSSSTGELHVWTVSRITDEDVHLDDFDNVEILDMDYEETGAVSSSFDFPDFDFKGGYYYEISLRVKGKCKTAEHIDTIWIPLSASFTISADVVYQDDKVTLTGKITGATSYRWTSDQGLNTDTSFIINDSVFATTVYKLIVLDNLTGCADTAIDSVKYNLYANAGRDTIICRGDTVTLGVATTIPGGFTYNWSPGGSLDDSMINLPKAFPDTTTVYTLVIKGPIGDTIETDEVKVWVDTLGVAGFSILQEDTLVFCFDNQSEPAFPTNSYTWDFGDGSSTTDSINPCHTFPTTGVDTFFVVCLTVSNACGDTTTCDTLNIDSTGISYDIDTVGFMPLSIRPDEQADQSVLIGNNPNPFTGKTVFEYRLASGTRYAEIVVTTETGVEIRRVPISVNETSIEVDFTTLAKGVYFYTLVVDGRKIQTMKMVIK